MAFTAITAGQVDADSPIDTTLMTKIKDNFDDLDAARVTNGDSHDHVGGDGAVLTLQMIGDAAVGDVVETPRDLSGSGTTTTPTPVCSVTLKRGGAYRIKWSMASNGGNWSYCRVYKNGVALGTQYNTGSVTPIAYVEDHSGLVAGDVIAVYAWISGATSSDITLFRLCTSTATSLLG